MRTGKVRAGKRRSTPNRRQKRWGNWRPYMAAPYEFGAAHTLNNGVQQNLEIAGITEMPGSLTLVPYDPAAQLAAGAVTISEEETFEVQVKGYIFVYPNTLSGAPSSLLLQWAAFKSQYQIGSGFVTPDLSTAMGQSDRNWLGEIQRVSPIFAPPSIQTARQDSIRMNFRTSLSIKRGQALILAFYGAFTSGLMQYQSFLWYRISRNVD